MNSNQLKKIVADLVIQGSKLKNQYTSELHAPIGYACIFCHTESEYTQLIETILEFGCVAKHTDAGDIYHIDTIETCAGSLKFLKIRKPDKTRVERGYVDFNVNDYAQFKETYLQNPRFNLLVRPNIELLELMDDDYNVRVYFPNNPVDKELSSTQFNK